MKTKTLILLLVTILIIAATVTLIACTSKENESAPTLTPTANEENSDSSNSSGLTTIPGGSITKDITWHGEIHVTGSLLIERGATLTILPGTQVKFSHYRGYREPEQRLTLEVEGSIIAIGTSDNPIYFTSDATNPQNGDWSMLRLVSPVKESQFEYCVFEFAQQGLNAWQASPQISHCVFRWNNWEGIYFESYCQPTLEYCQIYENGYNGLAAEQSNTITMDYCEVWRSGTNGVHIDNSKCEIRHSSIHDNQANGLSVDDVGTLRALGDTIYNNNNYAIGIGEGKNTVEVSNLNIYDNQGEIGGNYTAVDSSYSPPTALDLGFIPEQSYALGYIPGDENLDGYMYVYPDDETRCTIRKIGTGLGLTWALAWDSQYIWTCTVSAEVYKLNPTTGKVLDQFSLEPSSAWGTPSQPWGMAFDDEGYMWIVDFAERKIFKIDPSTHSILYSFDTPFPDEGGCKGLAWDGKYLDVLGWVSPVIYQMTKTGTLVNTIELDNNGGGGLAWDGEHFWVPGGGHILKYDSDGHQVGWIYAASEGTWDMTWDGTYLWASQRTNENWHDAKIFALEILKDNN